MNYYIADPHFGHANAVSLCNRPFADIEEMDRVLIESWNARVNRDDHVYVIGDFSFKATRPVSEYLEKLKGHKHLIIGNHDYKWMKKIDVHAYFESVDMLTDINDGKRRIVMCHYPMMSWQYRNSFLVYGHVHANKDMEYWSVLKTYDRALNAGVDVNGFQPVTFEELVVNNERWRREG